MGAPEGIRTPNLLIRSQMLYPLSYGRMAERPRQLYKTAAGAFESAKCRAANRLWPVALAGRLAAADLDVRLLDVHVGFATEIVEGCDAGSDEDQDRDNESG
jgi:hypothetical protein